MNRAPDRSAHVDLRHHPPYCPGMDRRRFLLISMASALAAPLAAGAQAGKVYRVGILQTTPNSPAVNYTEALRQVCVTHGYVEGQNIVIEHRMSTTPKDNPVLLADPLVSCL